MASDIEDDLLSLALPSLPRRRKEEGNSPSLLGLRYELQEIEYALGCLKGGAGRNEDVEESIFMYSRKKKVSEIDRLSELPDSILIRILSFLPTKLSVATTILGRRWRFLWAHVPNFDFDGETHSPESTMNFSDTINRVMLLSKVQTINTFRLYCSDKCRECEIETWLAAAIARNVQKFDLYIRCHDGFFAGLPRCVFTCKTLVDLRLHGCDLGFICCGLIISLPSLRKLQFSSVQFGCSDEALPRLFSGCPVLEELIIDGIVDRLPYCFAANWNSKEVMK
ncbi:hypothetical protein DH2020_024257 [Rehmannia glutinosa]|uniref:F-box/LRR-repeat protein 15/At3g58940/PEG3-like LRR domain-containing protein n=1 Tax=Rehmannia glutinosa TaxID=99300 RepID=A0ABR0WC62_REHGL